MVTIWDIKVIQKDVCGNRGEEIECAKLGGGGVVDFRL
jgi:hypothetical protein